MRFGVLAYLCMEVIRYTCSHFIGCGRQASSWLNNCYIVNVCIVCMCVYHMHHNHDVLTVCAS